MAVISDLQLPNTPSRDTHQYKSFESTLTMLRGRGMDVLIIAGDFTDLSTKYAWGHFKEIYDHVMAGAAKPIPCYIMGNHDYWLEYLIKAKEISTIPKLQKRYTKYTGEYPLSHKVINGYHFICWGSITGDYINCNKNTQWAKKQLNIAVADDPSKPVFVITHLNPSNTAYGSDSWGNDDIHRVLKDYPQAVSISGHSHYSIIDERSIWQKEYTAFTTKSLDYIEMEYGKYNCSIPKNAAGEIIADKVPACLYMSIEKDRVVIERLEANTGRQLKAPWVLEAPFDKPCKYTDARRSANKPPVLDEELSPHFCAITDVNGFTCKVLSFKAGKDDDFVHSYKLEFLDREHCVLEFAETDYDSYQPVLYNGRGEKILNAKGRGKGSKKYINSLLYFSDFILGLDNMADTVSLRLPNNIPETAEYVRITAIDSWGGRKVIP